MFYKIPDIYTQCLFILFQSQHLLSLFICLDEINEGHKMQFFRLTTVKTCMFHKTDIESYVHFS